MGCLGVFLLIFSFATFHLDLTIYLFNWLSTLPGLTQFICNKTPSAGLILPKFGFMATAGPISDHYRLLFFCALMITRPMISSLIASRLRYIKVYRCIKSHNHWKHLIFYWFFPSNISYLFRLLENESQIKGMEILSKLANDSELKLNHSWLLKESISWSFSFL